MKKLKSAILILLCAVFCISSTSCLNDENKYTVDLFALDTIINLTIYDENGENIAKECNSEILRLEKLFSVTDENSEIYKINNSNGKTISVSDELVNLIHYAQNISQSTQGAFDITLYPILKLYGFTTDVYNVPSQKEIEQALKLVNYENITIEENNITLEEGMQLDLGGIAKGYVAQKVNDIFVKNQVDKAVINIGGNVLTYNDRNNEDTWNIGIKSHINNDIFAVLQLSETSIATSGAYQRNFTVDDKFYHHIIDPKTGLPASTEIKSVTVVCDDAVKGDALSTAFYVMGIDEAIEYCSHTNDIDIFIISEDENIYMSKTLETKVTIENEYKHYKINYV